MDEIRWGIIGCGNVTEVKSGPAFNKVPRSKLVAVMRRDAAKAEDYAKRHHVPAWYSNADDLLNNSEVNAIYIATPPSSHLQYALAAINKRKLVYVEKPVSINHIIAKEMAEAAEENSIKLCVAHYRRQQPMFLKVRELILENAIGRPLVTHLKYFRKALTIEDLNEPGKAWRVDPSISGGGLFHDLAPHQIDLAYYFFGDVQYSNGLSYNQVGHYPADDIVAGNICFKNGTLFNGIWAFNSSAKDECDLFEIYGTEGKISFSVFSEPVITLENKEGLKSFEFERPVHVQQYLISAVVNYFLNEGPNPCSGKDAVEVMKVIDNFTMIRDAY